MERRKRVEAIMNSKLFREELERIVDGQLKEGPPGLLQQITDIMGFSSSKISNVFRGPNCVLPINDIRGVESICYDKGEKILRCKLASTFRLLDLFGWSRSTKGQITARLNADQELFLVNPQGLLFSEITAASLNKIDMQGNIVEQGTTNFGVDISRKSFKMVRNLINQPHLAHLPIDISQKDFVHTSFFFCAKYLVQYSIELELKTLEFKIKLIVYCTYIEYKILQSGKILFEFELT